MRAETNASKARSKGILMAWLAVAFLSHSDLAADADESRGLSHHHGLLAQAVPIRSDRGVFGSVAIGFGPIPSARGWQRIVQKGTEGILGETCDADDAVCGSGLVTRLRQLKGEGLPEAGSEMLSTVNSLVNGSITYRADRQTYGRADHWAELSATAGNGAGDCEDFAIAKMWALKSMGVPLHAMRLIVVRDTSRNRYHAVLSVRTAGRVFVLDSASDAVRQDTEIGHYVPIYSLGAEGSWIHGFRSEPGAVASALDRVRPGEPAGKPGV